MATITKIQNLRKTNVLLSDEKSLAFLGYLATIRASCCLATRFMVVRGPLTTISCEPRQVRKEAAVAVISGVEVRLRTAATMNLSHE